VAFAGPPDVRVGPILAVSSTAASGGATGREGFADVELVASRCATSPEVVETGVAGVFRSISTPELLGDGMVSAALIATRFCSMVSERLPLVIAGTPSNTATPTPPIKMPAAKVAHVRRLEVLVLWLLRCWMAE
jgi:hypothetical protein